jgi:glutathione synthase/RimK-type ligase-like ATP-grasp enzyme
MRVGSEFTPKLDGLHIAPAIFQKELAVDIEVRAIVVGEQVFAATVETQANTQPAGIAKHIRDNRRKDSSDTLQVTAFDLPNDIAKRCARHCKLLGLAFGAIDLIRDTQGKWWLLENNPNGQWAFVEAATNLPIGKSIADYLLGVSR